MSQNAHPVLTVIVRRFRREYSDGIETAIKDIQKTVSDQPGFIDLQNRITPQSDGCELVTVITFDTPENLERWERSPLRNGYVRALDQLSQDVATMTQFDDLSLLVAPKARISKLETVVILIAWILLLGHVLRAGLDMVLPGSVGHFWHNALVTSMIVVLISYVLLPVSSLLLTRFKTWVSRLRRR